MNRMLLLLARAPEQQAAVDKLVEEQHTPGSGNYRKWLTPAEFGKTFGPSDVDVQTITTWLQQKGFNVRPVGAGKSVIEFSGSAGQVRQAFHTEIHKYLVNGQEHWANAQDPQIPTALAPVIRGLVSLNNFPRRPFSHRIGAFTRDSSGAVTPAVTVSTQSGTYYAVGPADFATIYNSNPLLQSGNNGSGQTIAVLGRSNVHLQDITDFRNFFGLGAGNTSVVLDGPDPGIVAGDEDEAVLDLEWTNATAPGAAVMLVSAEDTETTSGLDLAALHVIENNIAGVMSVSFGTCEAYLGTTGNQYIQSLWEQAAAQGITVVVASGDSGSAGCDNQDVEYVATGGTAVSGFASTAYNVAVGGTDFDDVGTQSQYWNATNNSTTLGSAQSYVPETTWNGTCAASAAAGNLNVCPALPSSGTPPASLNLWSGSGGASSCVASTSSGSSVSCQNGRTKPAWQTGAGVPSDGVRDVPDVSLFAAVNTNSKSFYVVCQADNLPLGYPSCQRSGNVYFLGDGGTSAAAPSFAGLVALAAQKSGGRLGNLNYFLYSLASGSGASCTSGSSSASSCLFNDVVKGNNSVPCQAGSPNCSQTSGTATGVIVDSSQNPAFSAAAGYDLATGLGSVNAANLATAIASAVSRAAATSTSLTLNGSTAALTVQHGTAINVGVSVNPSASTGDVSLLGSSGGFDFSALSSGVASWSSKLFPGGTYSVTAHYAGDGTHAASDSNGVSVTINPEPSQTFLNLVTFGATGVQSFTANTAPYGSPYILRMDVTDAAGTVSSTQGVSSSCATRNASCPTGSLTLKSNGALLDGGSFALNSKGFAEDQPIQLAGGTYTLTASYPGDASYSASSGSSTVTISKAPTTTTTSPQSSDPYQYGTPVWINAGVTTTSSGVAPTGAFSFSENGSSATASVHNGPQSSQPGGPTGYASLSDQVQYAPPSLGGHTLAAQYLGDSNYSTSASGSFSINVSQATTTVDTYGISPNPATPSLPVTISATIGSGSQLVQPTGTVTFYDNGTPISGTITYGGNAGSWNGWNGSSNAIITAQLTALFSVVGTHNISVSYSGDTNYTAMTEPLTALTVDSKIPVIFTGLSSNMNPALTNYPVNLSASVTTPNMGGAPAPTGTLTFSDNGQQLSGTVTYTSNQFSLAGTLPYSFTTTGTHSINVTYSGDSIYAGSSSPQPLSVSVVDKLTTNIPFFGPYSAVANQPTTLSTNVYSNSTGPAPVMTGTVTFLDGGTAVSGTATYNDQPGSLNAQVPYTFTTAGTHSVTVQYSGDSHYAASTNTFSTDVLGPLAIRFPGGNNFTMIGNGGSSNVALNVINSTSSALTVSLTCTPDSSATSCSPSPATLSVPANNTLGITVNFTVPVLTASTRHARLFTMPFVFAGVLAALSFSRRKKYPALLLLAITAISLGTISCGGGGTGSGGGGLGSGTGGGSNPPPVARTYKFTVTATSGSNSDTQAMSVTVE